MASGNKQKTQKTAAKRVKRTGTGLIVLRHANHGHLETRKTQKHKRRLRLASPASAADMKQLNRLVPPGLG
jgi:large subunit ribosomal protein L35